MYVRAIAQLISIRQNEKVKKETKITAADKRKAYVDLIFLSAWITIMFPLSMKESPINNIRSNFVVAYRAH